MTKQVRFLAGFMAIALFTSLASAGDQPTTERPTWTEGSTWKYEGTSRGTTYYTTEVVTGTEEIAGTRHYVIRRGGQRVYIDQNLSLAVVKNMRGDVINEAVPPLEYFRWPLRVGAKWTQKVSHTIDGKTYNYEQEFRVLAYEKVKVPAGEFQAFKLSRAVLNGITYEEYWYAPEVKKVVKSVGTSATGGDYEHYLTGYELK